MINTRNHTLSSFHTFGFSLTAHFHELLQGRPVLKSKLLIVPTPISFTNACDIKPYH